MCTKSLVAVLLVSVLSQASGDRNLPVLFQFSQPSHNVAVYRGADLERARAAGLIKGFGGASASSSSSSSGDGSDGSDGNGSGNTYTPPTSAPPTRAPVVYTSPTPAPTPAPTTPRVQYKSPSPVTYRPAPAPVTSRPAPIVYRPAPVVYKPAPAPTVVYKPAPAPVVHYKPANAYVEPKYNDADAVYTWEYAVKDDYSSNDFGHKESRNGEHTDGKYYVVLPDGRLQTVTYTVDGYSGYVPNVEYTGEAKYVEAAPSYHA